MRRFYRGSTIPLFFTHPDYPKADWTAKLVLSQPFGNGGIFDASPSATEEKFEVTISAAQSSEIAAGSYQIHYRYENGDGEVSFLPGCDVEFLAAPTEAGDQRSQWEKDLAATDEAIRKKITGGAVESYSITTTVGSRNLTNMNLADLRAHRRWVLAQVDKERIKAGKRPLSQNRWKKISSHLGNQSEVPRRRY